MSDADAAKEATIFGHPTGLFTLFFAEMWERFSYYGMRALLVFYMIKGFLGYGDSDAYAVYGTYTALVYMTPFFGGMLADRLLGQRKAVIWGGILMGLGHLTMTIENEQIFFLALALLIAGNGFFKPNISTMVGSLYGPGNPRREGGFTLFYMGINLGAALAPLLCGYVGETYGWHYGFGLATIGMFIGLAVFWAPTFLAQILILLGALGTAGFMIFLQLDNHPILLILFSMVALALVVAGIVSFKALGRGGLPDHVGRPPKPQLLKERRFGLPNELAVYVGTLVAIVFFTILVSAGTGAPIISEAFIQKLQAGGGFGEVAGTFLNEISKWGGLILTLSGVGALVYLVIEAVRMEQVGRQRMFAALILIFFSLCFWAFFEQAGSSINNFTDRNVDRVFESEQVAEADIGQQKEVILTQALLGFPHPTLGKVTEKLTEIRDEAWANRAEGKNDYKKTQELDGKGEMVEVESIVVPINTREVLLPAAGGERVFVDMVWKLLEAPKLEDEAGKPLDGEARDRAFFERKLKITSGNQDLSFGGDIISLEKLDGAREAAIKRKDEGGVAGVTIPFTFSAAHVGMPVASYGEEIPASTFQSVNAIFIMIFGLIFTALWTFLSRRKMEPSTPMKFALGLAQLGLGFGALWYGADTADQNGMVAIGFLVLGYMLHTTGELCLSPVGLTMVTRMAPKRLVSTLMGMWFLATAFSNLMAAIIAQFTGVSHGKDSSVVPAPSETVNTYGEVFKSIAIAALVIAALCAIMSPLLKKWMHDDKPIDA